MRKVRKTSKKGIINRGIFLMLWECKTLSLKQKFKRPPFTGGFFLSERKSLVRKTSTKGIINRGIFKMLWECNTIQIQDTLRTRVK